MPRGPMVAGFGTTEPRVTDLIESKTMIRFLMSCTAAAALLIAVPVAANAATTPAKPAARTSMAKPVAAKPTAGKKPAAKPAARRDAGSAAVDALNEQSLARARGGQ